MNSREITFEPAKLEKLGASLDAEVKSAEILRGRLEALGSKAAEDDEREREKGHVKRARAVLAAYTAWLSDTSGEFRSGAEAETTEEDARPRDVRSGVPFPASQLTRSQREVQDIVRRAGSLVLGEAG